MSNKVYQKSIFFTFCVVAFLCIGVFSKKSGATSEDYVKTLTDGINLGNTYETGIYDTVYSDKQTIKTMVDNLVKEGYTSLRIPITWDGQFDESTGVVNEEFYTQLSTVIDYAIEKKMQVILTMYNDSNKWINNMENQSKEIIKYKKLWKNIATHYKYYSDLLSFEGANAPYFDNLDMDKQLTVLTRLNRAFVKIVRATGGNNTNRTLFISTLNGQVTEETCDNMISTYQKIGDKNVAVSVHYYGLWGFSVNACGNTTFDSKVKADIKTFRTLIHKKFQNNNIPVVCTEYGLYGQASDNQQINHGEMIKYYEEFLYQIRKCGLSCMLWDTGSLFDRGSGTWADDELGSLIKMAKRYRSAVAETDSIYIKEGEACQDVTIPLTLHGAKVSGVKEDGEDLELNEDYAVVGDSLVIRQEYLELLNKENSAGMGEIATLSVEFTKGCPFTLHIKRTDAKTMEPVETTEDEMVIPTLFHGDTIVSMEAVTADKKAVGPLDYTAFQEYNYAFIPNYNNSTVTLTKVFLESIGNDKVTLTFHFKSGDALDYSIIRDGDAIREVSYKEDATPATVAPETPKATEAPEETASVANAVVSQTDAEKDPLERPFVYIFVILVVVCVGISVAFIYSRNKFKRKSIGTDDEKSTGDSIDK